MANELNIPLDRYNDAGLTLTAQVFSVTGVQQGGDVAMSEVYTAGYSGTFSTVRADGQYTVRFTTATETKGVGAIYIRDNVEISQYQFFKEAEYTAPDNAGITANGVAVAALNDFDPATDAVANVTTVGNMRGTDSAATAAAVAALNDFDPATDAVANVTTVGNMRGTDSAATDTGMTAAFTEIKGGTWSAATDTLEDIRDAAGAGGGLTEATLHDGLDTYTNKPDWKADVSNLDAAVSSRLATVGYAAPDNVGISANGNAIASLNDFDPALDTVANVATVTANTDMRGTDSAATAAAVSNLNDFDPATDIVANVNAVAVNADMRGTDNAATVTQVSNLNDFDPATDTVANVATVTTNTDMRGTDGANTVEPENADIQARLVSIKNDTARFT